MIPYSSIRPVLVFLALLAASTAIAENDDVEMKAGRVMNTVESDRLSMARELLATSRWDEVPIALGRLTRSSDADVAAEALLILGRAKYEAGQYDTALNTFRRIYELPASEAKLARAHLAVGWSMWKLHRYEEIAAEAQAFAKDDDCGAEFHYLLGMADYEMNDFENAVEHLRRAADESSVHRAPALFYLAECYRRSSRHKEARARYQRLIDVEPASEWADDAVWGLVRTARSARMSLEMEAALDLLKEQYPKSEYISQSTLLEINDDSCSLETIHVIDLLEEAVGHERDGNFDSALSVYHQFLKLETTDALRSEGLWRAARLHDRLQQYAEATELYTRLITDFPQYGRLPEVMTNMARIAETTGKLSQAAKHYQNVLERFPEDAHALEAAYWLALVAADEQRSGEAQTHVDWLLERLGKDYGCDLWLRTLCLQCQLFASSGSWQSIVELLDPFLGDISAGEDPLRAAVLSARLQFWRAEASLRLGDVEDASARFGKLTVIAVGVNESWVPMVTLRQAQIAARREDWQVVLKLVDEMDKRHPEFDLAYECDYLRGRALAGRGEMSAARTAYAEVLENEWAAGTETAALAQWMIGETYFHQRSYELAGVAYQRVIERHNFPEWQARAALQAGKCAELSDHWDKAIEFYAGALERCQGSKSTKELKARLQWVQKQIAQGQGTLRR